MGDIVVHQAGNAEELARVLHGHLAGAPVPTRGFEEREAPYRAMSRDELWTALEHNVGGLSEVSDVAQRELGSDADVAWTGRTMKVSWFPEHLREELVLHRWDMTGDDETALRSLSEPWMTTHTVIAVGTPLLKQGAKRLAPIDSGCIGGRLRTEGSDDVVVVASPDRTEMSFAPVEGTATIESDAAVRCLFLWGRRPADPSRWRTSAAREEVQQLRTLLSGY